MLTYTRILSAIFIFTLLLFPSQHIERFMKSKHRKIAKKGKDIISRLPDEILVHILSRLPTLDSVRTCILSSRWKNIWKSIYNLNLECESKSELERMHRWGDYKGISDPFLFINQVVGLLQSKNIRSFHLYANHDSVCTTYGHFLECPDGCTMYDHINEWAAYAAGHNVCEMTIRISDGNYTLFKVPESILTCTSLVRLTLDYSDVVFDIPDSLVCFPSLKSLYITIFIDGRDVDHLGKLFHGCPVLEDLTISITIGNFAIGKIFEITLPRLRTLRIDGSIQECNEVNNFVPNKFMIAARDLEYVYIKEYGVFSSFLFGESAFLSNTILDSINGDIPAFVSKNEGNQTMQLLSGIKNTRSLKLSADIARVLSFAFDGNMPIFPNLTHLELSIEAHFGWKLLPHFLTNSSNLQVLILKQDHRAFGVEEDHPLYEVLGPDDYVWFDLENVSLSHMKRIRLENMVGKFNELEVIRYLLKHSNVLETFSIEIKIPNSKEAKQIRNLVLDFPKCSPLCEIKFL